MSVSCLPTAAAAAATCRPTAAAELSRSCTTPTDASGSKAPVLVASSSADMLVKDQRIRRSADGYRGIYSIGL